MLIFSVLRVRDTMEYTKHFIKLLECSTYEWFLQEAHCICDLTHKKPGNSKGTYFFLTL